MDIALDTVPGRSVARSARQSVVQRNCTPDPSIGSRSFSESRQIELPRWAACSLMVSPPVAIGQMGHDFQHQQIGPRHHVPRAAIAERADQLFEHLHVELHRALGRDIGLGEQAGQRRPFPRPDCRLPSRHRPAAFRGSG